MEQRNPWLTIWTSPRMTIARVVAENPNRSLWWLAAIYGFCSILNFFQSMAAGHSMGTMGILILSVILAPFYGYLSFAIWSWFVLFTGKWFKGQGTFKTIRASYAWSCVPILINVPLWLLMVILFGHQLFTNFPDAHTLPTGQMTLLFVILIVKVVVAIWSLVIFLNALAEVQNYSIVRSIFNVIVAGLVLGVIFFVFWSLLVYAFGGVATSPFLLWKFI
ncbi:MAG: YIP1 family protein [Verrucomicrobia bacterium]|nr:YIP1 family protein [Verrucomicrobiota bacterium]MDE3047136.1 YIP1 family protein [Verrucomicrobiota bacterium]